MIPLGKWLPDQPRTLQTPHLRDAKNVIPLHSGYGPAKALAVSGNALAARPYGAAAFRDSAGNVHLYAGTETALYERESDGTWTDRTRSMGGAYASGSTGYWRFAQFGDYVIATNFIDDVQYKDMTTTDQFSALPGSPPKAKFVFTVNDFVFLGYTNSSSFGVAWSAINDPETWTAGTNLSGAQTFPDHGFVQGISGADVAYIFQQRSIQRGQFVGPPLVWEFDQISHEHGVFIPGSLCQSENAIFYRSDNGFYMLADDKITPIGDEMVDDWFKNDVNGAFSYRMTAAVDGDAKIASWSYASTNSPTGVPDTKLNYHYTAGKWSYERVQVEPLFNSLTLGYTLEGLDALSASLDALEISLDDPLLQGGDLRFGGFDSAYKYGVFSGSNLEATVETSDVQPFPGHRGDIRAVTPHVGASAATVAIGSRERQADTTSFKSAASMEASGRVPVRASGRWFSSKIVVPAGESWDEENPLTGYEYEGRMRGRR